ncbi:CU044_2847 family protein [Kitasatospora sp. NPDC101801]|uniref:CU044_2847 family protein n=1 Tax=Kitasatospora sp. NPDC101801 TaxID=3364103 RepID=UPI003800902F
MSEYTEFVTAEGAVVRVERQYPSAGPDEYGMRPVGRGPAVAGVERAGETFEQALAGVRAAAGAALAVFRDGSLKPDEVEIEFGVKLTAEAGALIARTAAEAHLTVRLSWAPGRQV